MAFLEWTSPSSFVGVPNPMHGERSFSRSPSNVTQVRWQSATCLKGEWILIHPKHRHLIRLKNIEILDSLKEQGKIATNYFCMWNLGRKNFGTLGLSSDRKSVMEIAQNYRKTIICELPANRLSPEKKGKFSPLQLWSGFRCENRMSLSSQVLSEHIPQQWDNW